MESIELQGNTLGEKHKYYNELVTKTSEKKLFQNLTNIDYGESDLDNIFKIDMASRYKNVEYIVEVLKCEDMYYVSRAIKQSLWLITDEKYSYIVNPEYLHCHLFPQMTTKAINKFTLYIRLNLKNENRVEGFFNYYKNVNLDIALKWLPNCSLQFTEHAIETYSNNINICLLKRLCEKSITFLEIYIKVQKDCNKRQIMNDTTFLIHGNLERYLNLIEAFENYEFPQLGSKQTKRIMTVAPERVFRNFEIYAHSIHLPTFVKFIKPENIRNFLLEHQKNEKLQKWFCHDNLKPFILMMPQENRLEFVKVMLMGKKDKDLIDDCKLHDSLDSYLWYKYAPFQTAFTDLKKLIHRESSSSERISMLEVLLCSAGRNMLHIQTLLQYFCSKHINEPYKFKIKFINTFLKHIRGCKLNDLNWQNLNALFHSLDVYSESKHNNNVQSCIIVSIVHNILNNENVPNNIENKFCFDTLKEYRLHLNKNDSEKIFDYLYNYTFQKINVENINNEFELRKKFILMENILKLLSDWEKDLLKFPIVLITVQKLVTIMKTNSWTINVLGLYNIKKSWRKHLFALSLDLWPSQEACVNALKHDPNLLLTSKNALENLYRDDSLILKHYLNKVRIYWSSSLANKYVSYFYDELHRRTDNKTFVRHLFVLLPQKDFLDLVKKYVPEEEKINWNQYDKSLLDIRKNVAKFIHFARPQASLEVVLWYAKGDYLQFTISSLMSILSNMSCRSTVKHIKTLIEAPVSLRKHGVRTAIHHMKSEEIIEMFSIAWDRTKNSSIRGDIFISTFKLLCKEKNVETIEKIWTLLDGFIDKLTNAETKGIYDTLNKVHQVPLCVRVPFFKKSLQFLKTLPSNLIPDYSIQRLISRARDFMGIMDVDFIAAILLEDFKQNLMTDFKYGNLISSCLLFVESDESQLERYKKVFTPVMEICVQSWNKKDDSEFAVRRNLCNLLKQLCVDFKNYVLKKEMVIPSIIFNEIHHYLLQNLPVEENYVLLRTWKLVSSLINIINHNISSKTFVDKNESTSYNTFNAVVSISIPEFAMNFLKYVREDMESFYHSIYLCFGDALNLMWDFFYLEKSLKLQMLISILSSDMIESYLLVLNLIPDFVPEHLEPKHTELIDKILSHPSPEIKFYFNRYIEQRTYSIRYL